MVYRKSGTSWGALPYTWGNLSYIFFYDFHQYEIVIQNTDDPSAPSIPTSDIPYRVVVISQQLSAAHPNVDLTNYFEVKEAFNLAD